jgi:hypothetical protein
MNFHCEHLKYWIFLPMHLYVQSMTYEQRKVTNELRDVGHTTSDGIHSETQCHSFGWSYKCGGAH